MKNLYILSFLFISTLAQEQISSNGTTNGSITITPKGLKGSSNSTDGGGNLVVGSNALKKTLYDNVTPNFRNGKGNTAVGNSSLFANISGIQNSALGAYSLQNKIDGVHNKASGYGQAIIFQVVAKKFD